MATQFFIKLSRWWGKMATNKIKENSTNQHILKSPDSPAIIKEDDRLGRWRFAKNIYELIKNSPLSWSLRVAVFGAWGEGKTSVLKFIEKMALKEKNVVAWFNPWEAQDREELWTDFATSIYDAIEEADVKIPKKLRNKIRKLTAIIEEPFDKASRLDSRLNLAASLIKSPLKRWLSVKEGELISIPKLLEDKRLIVMIDDIDRANPDIIPNLLLSLRELLDIPSFTFIMAFDPDVVSDALLKNHPGWKSGSQFIDKIIDFPFWLPNLTQEQINELAIKEFNDICEFVDSQSVERILDLVPSNPRKLKQYIRNLWYLKPELKRHEKYELNWTTILLSQLLKLEFPSLFEMIFNSEEVLYDLTSLWIEMPQENDPLEDMEEEKPEYINKFEKIITEGGIREKQDKKRALELLIALGLRTSLAGSSILQYNAQLGTHPHAITWKEFLSFYNDWKTDPVLVHISKWINNHIALREEDPQKVFNETFEATVNYRLKLLSEAADTPTLDEMRSKAEEAELALKLLHQLCFELNDVPGTDLTLTIDHFCKLLSMVEKWSHFRNDPKYKELRQKEAIFMVEYVEKSKKLANEILKSLEPWGFHFVDEPIREFRCELATIAQEFLVIELLQRFEQPDGIKDLWGRDRRIAEKYTLFRIDSPIWETQNRKIFNSFAQRAKSEPFIHENFIEFISMLAYWSKEGIETLNPDEIKRLAQDTQIVEVAWKAAISRPIQPRLIGSFRNYREDLKKIAGSDEHLSKPAFFDTVI